MISGCRGESDRLYSVSALTKTPYVLLHCLFVVKGKSDGTSLLFMFTVSRTIGNCKGVCMCVVMKA